MAAGCATEILTSLDAVKTKAPDFVALDFFADGISPHDLTDGALYAAELAPVADRIGARRILLFDSPRGPKSLDLAIRIGLACTIEDHDLWVGLSPALLGDNPYQSGINGYEEALLRIGCEIERERDGYAKAPVRPFSSLIALVHGYLQQLRAQSV
ncbi:MAG TPA: hypothetical protein VIA18_07420 [Polyangia bacterium]|nr:hypothetical protein [Polyangia bacterium]